MTSTPRTALRTEKGSAMSPRRYLDFPLDGGFHQLEIAPAVARVVMNKRAHAPSVADEPLYEVTADEATGAGDEYLLPLQAHLALSAPRRGPFWGEYGDDFDLV
jgi:hypothetical protein